MSGATQEQRKDTADYLRKIADIIEHGAESFTLSVEYDMIEGFSDGPWRVQVSSGC